MYWCREHTQLTRVLNSQNWALKSYLCLFWPLFLLHGLHGSDHMGFNTICMPKCAFSIMHVQEPLSRVDLLWACWIIPWLDQVLCGFWHRFVWKPSHTINIEAGYWHKFWDCRKHVSMQVVARQNSKWDGPRTCTCICFSALPFVFPCALVVCEYY